MLSHDDFFCADTEDSMLGGPGAAVDVFCAAEVADALAPGESLRQWNGLHLTAAVLPETAKLRLFFDSQAEPLMLSESEVAHFRSFLQVTVVEQVLARLQAGEPMQIDAPFARLRDFGGFLTVCAGGHGVPEGATPLKMALAPDAGDEGRRLAAVFTAEDALQLFVVARDANARDSDGLVSVRLSGAELFEQIATNGELEGMVFNPFGPTAPVALAREAAQDILAGE